MATHSTLFTLPGVIAFTAMCAALIVPGVEIAKAWA